MDGHSGKPARIEQLCVRPSFVRFDAEGVEAVPRIGNFSRCALTAKGPIWVLALAEAEVLQGPPWYKLTLQWLVREAVQGASERLRRSGGVRICALGERELSVAGLVQHAVYGRSSMGVNGVSTSDASRVLLLDSIW